MSKVILMIGAFDTKSTEYTFLREQIMARGHNILAVNIGVLGTTDLFPIEVQAEEVAEAGGGSLKVMREKKDRGEAMKLMSQGAPIIVKSLFNKGKFDGIIGMGGTGGTSVITAAMRTLPIGVPKVCISTAASGNTAAYVGSKDITMIPSIVDVAGINRISKLIFSRAAGAICGMVDVEVPKDTKGKPIIAASMFGNSTACVNACAESLTSKGYEVLVFHATGTGGKTMESLVSEGLVDAVLDITTTEWADTVCGGVFNAGPERLSAPGQMGIPHLIVPGCVDMANFDGMESVPQKYKDAGRTFYEWNPSVTLMRTNVEENKKMGEIFAKKANAATGPVAFLIPLKGVSILDSDGELFCDREVDQAMFDAIKLNVRSDVPVIEVNYNINDLEFAAKAVETMEDLIQQGKERGSI